MFYNIIFHISTEGFSNITYLFMLENMLLLFPNILNGNKWIELTETTKMVVQTHGAYFAPLNMNVGLFTFDIDSII